MANVTIFENASVFDGIASELAEGQSVVVEGDRTKEVTDRLVDVADAQRFDLHRRRRLGGEELAQIRAYTAEAIDRCIRLGVRSIEHANLIDEPTPASNRLRSSSGPV